MFRGWPNRSDPSLFAVQLLLGWLVAGSTSPHTAGRRGTHPTTQSLYSPRSTIFHYEYMVHDLLGASAFSTEDIQP